MTLCLLLNRETGALCAMKEVELFDDPKSKECIKQLEQVVFPLFFFSIFVSSYVMV